MYADWTDGNCYAFGKNCGKRKNYWELDEADLHRNVERDADNWNLVCVRAGADLCGSEGSFCSFLSATACAEAGRSVNGTIITNKWLTTSLATLSILFALMGSSTTLMLSAVATNS